MSHSNWRHHKLICEVMQLTNEPWRSWDINDAFANLNNGHRMMSPSGRLSELHANWYIDVVHISVKEDRENAWEWYVLTDKWKVPWVVPIITLKADWTPIWSKSKTPRSSTEESIVKKESKEIERNKYMRLEKFQEFIRNNPDIYFNEQEWKRERGIQIIAPKQSLFTRLFWRYLSPKKKHEC